METTREELVAAIERLGEAYRQLAAGHVEVAAQQRRLALLFGVRLPAMDPQESEEGAVDAVVRLVTKRGTLKIRGVAFALGIAEPVARMRLKRAVTAGKLRRVSRGVYAV